MKFTTKDVDNDIFTGINRAQKYQGAWWFRKCYDAHLNGEYLKCPCDQKNRRSDFKLNGRTFSNEPK